MGKGQMLPVHAGSDPKQPNQKRDMIVVLLEAFLASTKFVQSLYFPLEGGKETLVGPFGLPARGQFA